jgi:hypothetical protein
VDGIGKGPVVSAVLGEAVEIERGAVLPSGDNAFAKFVFVNLGRDGCCEISGRVRPSHCSTLKTV